MTVVTKLSVRNDSKHNFYF